MKTCILICVFFLAFFFRPSATLADTGKPFEIHRLTDDVQVNGWKWQHGDDKRWASPGWNDSKWKDFDPSADIKDVSDQSGIYWLRVHVLLDSTIGTNDYSFSIKQSVASEIYVDGKLRVTYGRFANRIEAYDPLNIPLQQLLAERNALRQNLERITHHGKRADQIVKAMLEHSRTSTGQKEPVNIGKLAEEYLHLAYHGMRAKDKNFNAQLVTSFAQLPPVEVVPQNMGRVFLNLINNAFYAVNEKQKTESQDYKPTVEIIVNGQDGNIRIMVKDNGTGIPPHLKDKIMQPFFTTKPPGEGTGLGLSLSYDIIVKEHKGKLHVESSPGQGTTMAIELPASNRP